MQIEDYHSGYPRFSALVAAHDSFHVCRRFSNLRARLLLLKQDKLSLLESELERIDREEPVPLFLGSSRRDKNHDRRSILLEIDHALADYDAFVERTHRTLRFKTAKAREVSSLQSWVNGNSCIARAETAYLTRRNDLVSMASADDGAVTRVEAWIEDNLVRFCKGFYKKRCNGISRDSNIFISSGSLLTLTARMLIISLITSFLLAPVVICNLLDSIKPRLLVILVATILSVATLSGLAKARTVDTFIAGAAYAAVLVVFVSGTDTIYKPGYGNAPTV